MRMWMINPKMLCDKHLRGEHGEIHKFLPSFRKGTRVHGRFHPNVQIQFKGYRKRHDRLVKEMKRRGMNHKSPLVDVPDFKSIYPDYYNLKVDKWKSIADLMLRCDDCKKRNSLFFENDKGI